MPSYWKMSGDLPVSHEMRLSTAGAVVHFWKKIGQQKLKLKVLNKYCHI